MTPVDLVRLCNIVQAHNLQPIVIGRFLSERDNKDPVLRHLADDWLLKDVFQHPLFDASENENAIFNQLLLLDLLRTECKVIASVGYQSGGMDGGAFIGIKSVTIVLKKKKRADESIDPKKACPRVHQLSEYFSEAFVLCTLAVDEGEKQKGNQWTLTHSHVKPILECFAKHDIVHN
jgi:hypothetical protein